MITNAAEGNPNVKALVYVDAAAPDGGETNGSLSGSDSILKQKPESELFDKVPYPGAPPETIDLYLKKDVFLHNFGNDLPADEATRLWATQRVASSDAFTTPSKAAAWKTIPSWYFINSGRPDHHAHLREAEGRAGTLPRNGLRRRLASDADVTPGGGDRRDRPGHRMGVLTPNRIDINVSQVATRTFPAERTFRCP